VNAPSTTPSVKGPCAVVLPTIRQALARAGLQSLETFDLQAARLAATDCMCPHHGTADCDCQMVVLLVYGASGTPATLIVHGSDGQTWISMPGDASQPTDPTVVAAVEQSLQEMRAALRL
jgi:hypothetical protein